MLSIEKTEKFAELAVRIGANLQKGQEVVIRCDVAVCDFAHTLAKKAYEFGAKRVIMQWRDEKISRINMDNADTETLCDIPNFELAQNDYFIDKKCCLISVAAGDPNIFSGCDPEKISKVNAATGRALKKFREATMSNLLRWTIVSVPTESWAKTVFPNESPSEAVDKLWESIATAMRLNEPDPIKAWETHLSELRRRADYLNSKNFSAIRMRSGNGTNIEIGLAEDHVWLPAEEMGQDGIPFTANMPTEEIFTAPHRERVNGTVVSAMPLVHNGTVIDDFEITFVDGKIVDFCAKTGYDTLKGLISTDEGTARLGEIALIGKSSPISQLGILFYNTLFDENASCHLALGQGYPTTVKNGNDLKKEELIKKGVNDSIEHVDFMIGTPDLKVQGVTSDGKVTNLFIDGEWVI